MQKQYSHCGILRRGSLALVGREGLERIFKGLLEGFLLSQTGFMKPRGAFVVTSLRRVCE